MVFCLANMATLICIFVVDDFTALLFAGQFSIMVSTYL